MRRLVLLGALALSACGHHIVEAPRLLRVVASADSRFRERPHWRDVITSRIQKVSLLYQSAVNIRLELVGISEWNPDDKPGLEFRRRQLGGYNSDGSLVLLGFAKPAEGPEPGVTLTFDPRVLVFDYPGQSEEQNERILAHELAHMMGAWHSGEETSLLHLPPGNAFDSTARQAIRLTRLFALGVNPGDLDRHQIDELARLYAGSGSDASANPLFQMYLYTGNELWNNGHQEESLEPLTRAAELSPRDANAHYVLGRANLFTRRFVNAAAEFRKALEINPQHSPSWNGLGGTLLNMDQPEEALRNFRKALELDPSNRMIRANIGKALARLPGHMEEGIAQIQELVRSDPKDLYAQQAFEETLEFKRQATGGR
jgi:hypothetical protein